jgi:diacylglycerol kinase (ATP)
LPDCVIYNPNAGSADELEAHHDALRDLGFDLCPSSSPDDAKQMAIERATSGMCRIVAAGGDGTVNSVASGILDAGVEQPPALGVLPLGTGNDYRRSLHMPDDVGEAVAALGGAVVKHADVMRYTINGDDGRREGWAINLLSGGFGGELHEHLTDEIKQRWGVLAYLRVAAVAAADPTAYAATLSVFGAEPAGQDEADVEEGLALSNIVVANGRYVGGGFVAAPDADPFDGKLNVVVIQPPRHVGESIAIAARVMAADLGADYTDSAAVRTWHARGVRLTSEPPMPITIDGEITVARELIAEVHRAALPVLVPSGSTDDADAEPRP